MDTIKDCKIPECGNLEILRKSKVVVGAKQLRKALQKGTVRCVFLAENADPAITEPMEEECTARGVPVETEFTLAELGRACRISVGAAVAVILK